MLLLAKMFVSFLVSHWLYSEVCFFFPSFDNHARQFVEAVEVPTHNEWPEIARSPGGMELQKTIATGVDSSGLRGSWPVTFFSDSRLGRFWDRAWFLGSGTRSSTLPYLSGDAIFSPEPWHPMQSVVFRRRQYRPSSGFVEVQSVEDIEHLMSGGVTW